MKYYWRAIFLWALLMLPVGYVFDWMALGLSASVTIVLAGWAGVRLAPKVPQLRTLATSGRHFSLVAGILIANGILLGIAGWLHLAVLWNVLWSVGLFGVLVLPLAAHAHDVMELEGNLFHRGAGN